MGILVDSANGIKTARLPIWFMRQAGRYLPEYREVRSRYSNFLDFCYSVEDAAKVSIQPLERYDIDAAIIFSDILVIPDMLDLKVTFTEGYGPSIDLQNSIVSEDFNQDKLEKLLKAIRSVRNILDEKYPQKDFIGFAGAPFTLAYYTFCADKDKRYDKIKELIAKKDKQLDEYIEIYTKFVIKFLQQQILAGVNVIKIFDSWAGILEAKDLRKYSLDPIKKIINAIRNFDKDVTIIVFPRGVKENIRLYSELPEHRVVIALDEEIRLADAVQEFKHTLQGNIANRCFFWDKKEIDSSVDELMKIVLNRPHIYNLGHGVLPETNPEMVSYLINKIRSYEERKRNS